MEDGIDITNAETLNSQLSTVNFDFLLHLAAYTNVDKAEVERDLCRRINIDGTRNLYEICQQKKARMIYISTDYVFDGLPLRRHPERGVSRDEGSTGQSILTYSELSTPHPLGYYAQTKYEGEQIVKESSEIFHVVGPEAMSSYDLGMRIAEKYGLDKNLLQKTTHAAYSQGKASRPQYAHIVSTKELGVKMQRLG